MTVGQVIDAFNVYFEMLATNREGPAQLCVAYGSAPPERGRHGSSFATEVSKLSPGEH